MQLKTDKALRSLEDGFDDAGVYDQDNDKLAAERQAADEEIAKLKTYKSTIQTIVDERALLHRLIRAGLTSEEVEAAHQAVMGVGGIETAEAVNG
jgi:cell division protein FtsB